MTTGDHRSDSKSASNSDSDSDYDYAFGVTERLSPLTITPLATEPSASQIATWSSELPSPDAVSPTITNSALDAPPRHSQPQLWIMLYSQILIWGALLASLIALSMCLALMQWIAHSKLQLRRMLPWSLSNPTMAKAVTAAKKAVADSNSDWSVCDHKTLHSLAYTLHVIRPERSSLLASLLFSSV